MQKTGEPGKGRETQGSPVFDHKERNTNPPFKGSTSSTTYGIPEQLLSCFNCPSVLNVMPR